jgi:hypothetical protein
LRARRVRVAAAFAEHLDARVLAIHVLAGRKMQPVEPSA